MEATNIEKIKKTLQQINALATGAGATTGEQEAVRRMLEKLLEKYKLTQAELFNNLTFISVLNVLMLLSKSFSCRSYIKLLPDPWNTSVEKSFL